MQIQDKYKTLKKFISLNTDNRINFIDRLSLDSRNKLSGKVFISLATDKDKNLNNILDAIKNGASAIVTKYDFTRDYLNDTTPYYIEENLDNMYHLLFMDSIKKFKKKLQLVGITGTDGKTSTSLLLASSLTKLKNKVGVITSEGIGIFPKLNPSIYTTPTIDIIYRSLYTFLSKRADVVIIECSSQGLAQDRMRGLSFDFGIITNIRSDHLDYHLSLSKYIKSKLLILEKSKTSILNYDQFKNVKIQNLNYRKNTHVLSNNPMINKRHGYSENYILYNREKIHIPNKIEQAANKNSIYIIVILLKLLGYKKESIQKVLLKLKPIRGRRNIIHTKNKGLFIIDYAHTLSSFTDIYKITKLQDKKVVSLFGCGGDRDKSKRPLIAEIVCQNSDSVIITEDNSRNESFESVKRDIFKGIINKSKCYVIKSRKTAIKKIYRQSKSNYVNFILGKGNEDYIYESNKTRPHNDIEYLYGLIRDDKS